MPIRPENKDKYPPNWKEIVARIKARAGNQCEQCGAINYMRHPTTGSTVILTTAHLDHNPEHNEDENLKSLCQRCHNIYDAKNRAKGIRERKNQGQLTLFKEVSK